MNGGNCAAYFAGSCAALCSAASFAASVEGLPKTLASITYCIIHRPSVAPSNISILPQSRHLHFHSFSLSCPVVLPFALLSSSATIRTLTGCSTQKSEEEKEEQKKELPHKKKEEENGYEEQSTRPVQGVFWRWAFVAEVHVEAAIHGSMRVRRIVRPHEEDAHLWSRAVECSAVKPMLSISPRASQRSFCSRTKRYEMWTRKSSTELMHLAERTSRAQMYATENQENVVSL